MTWKHYRRYAGSERHQDRSECTALGGARRNHAQRLVFLTVLIVLAITVGCRQETPAGVAHDPPRLEGGSGSLAITYQPNVRIFDRAEGLTLINAISSDGSTILFDNRTGKFASLKPDDIILIKGLVARKVLAVEQDGTNVAALTLGATLGEVIREGRIQIDAPIRFSQSDAAESTRDLLDFQPHFGELLWAVAAAQSPEADRRNEMNAYKSMAEKTAKAIYEGWETKFAASPGAGRLNIFLEMKKSVGGFVAIITGAGYLADFDMSSGIEVQRGLVERLQLAHKKLNGTMNFKWEVAKETPGVATGDDRIKLPAAISIPLYQYLEGFPLFLEISSAVIIKPAISSGKEYSRGAFRITYDGYQAFKAKEGTIDAQGNVKGDIQFLESQNVSPLAPMGMVVAFAAPRIELSFGITKIVKFSGGMKDAAKYVDGIADRLIKQYLGAEGYARFKASPMGGLTLTKAIENAVKSDAAGYIELISTSGMSHTGMSAIVPCTRTDLHFIVKVGASAQAFGQKLGNTEQEIFTKDFTRIDPPGTRLCESVGP